MLEKLFKNLRRNFEWNFKKILEALQEKRPQNLTIFGTIFRY